MQIRSDSIRQIRILRSFAFFLLLCAAAVLTLTDSANGQAVRFIAPAHLKNVESLPEGGSLAVGGRFRAGASMDILFQGVSFNSMIPMVYSDVARYAGNGAFAVSQVSDGFSDGGSAIGVDLNGDGLTDLVTFFGPGFVYQFAKGDGTFTDTVYFALDRANTVGPSAIAAADLDGNGTMDLGVLTDHGTLMILLNDGKGSLHIAGTYPAPAKPANSFNARLVAGDINGDSLPDLAVVYGVSGAKTGTVTPYLSTHAGAFVQGATYTAAADGLSAGMMDINRDGHADVVFTSATGIGVFLGSSTGALKAGTSIRVAGGRSLILGDLNKDGKMDLAISGTLPLPGPHVNQAPNSTSFVNVYLGNGNGTFQDPTVYGTGNVPVSLIAGDIYGNGNLDLATLNSGDASLSVLRNLGNGYYQAAPVSHATGATGVVAGDFNRDGNLDVAVVNTLPCKAPCSGTVTVFPGSGSNFFNTEKSYAIGMHGAAIAAGDLNKDGILDLVVVNAIPGDAADTSVLLGKADGTFQPAHNFTLGSLTNEAYIIDVNHDGVLDLVTAGGVALGKGDGTFLARKPFPGFSYDPTLHFALGDVNGDGNVDAVVALSGGSCSAEIQVLEGDGKGNFPKQQAVFDNDSNPITSIALGKLRPAGPLDIVYSSGGLCGIVSDSEHPSEVAGFAGKGDGTFPTSFGIMVGGAAGDPFESGPVVIADFNGDGKPDVGVGAQGSFIVAAGNGNDTFQPSQLFSVDNCLEDLVIGTKTYDVQSGIAVGDFLKDGKLDVVLTSGLGVARLYNITAAVK